MNRRKHTNNFPTLLDVKRVPAWVLAGQLGHAIPGFKMTERYAPYAPEYLAQALLAIDELLTDLRATCVPPRS